MAYGSPAGVASLAKTWTDNGEFFDEDLYQEATPTTLEEVTDWLSQVSAFMDIALAGEGFTIPISHIEVLKAINLKVNALVSDLVHLQHNKGRLFSDRIRDTGQDPLEIIEKDVFSWVKKRAGAFENMGIPRVIDLEDSQGYSIPAARQL